MAAVFSAVFAFSPSQGSSLGSADLRLRPATAPVPLTEPEILGPAIFLGMDEDLLLEHLRQTEIRSVQFGHGGSSLVLRLEFSDGSRAAFKPEQTHPQTVPRKEAAAYQLSRKLGLSQVPPTAMRTIGRDELVRKLKNASTSSRIDHEALFDSRGQTTGSVMHWVPGLSDTGLDADAAVLAWTTDLSQDDPVSPMKRPLLEQLSALLLFDVLQNNSDRFSGGNILGRNGRMFFIDNAFGFQADPTGHVKALGYFSRCRKFSRKLWVALQMLRPTDLAFVDPVFGPLLSIEEQRAILGRRDQVLRRIERYIQMSGERAVLEFE